MNEPHSSLRAEIAATAARLIADSGLDYAGARRRAVSECLGNRSPRGSLPDFDDIDEALREHLNLFDEEHDDRVRGLREAAAELMQALAEFSPLVTGAAWKGIAAAHAPLHLQLFADNPKEVSYWLLNRRIDFDVGTMGHFRGPGEVEVLAFDWKGVPVMLSLHDRDDLRGALQEGHRGAQRGDREALLRRMEQA